MKKILIIPIVMLAIIMIYATVDVVKKRIKESKQQYQIDSVNLEISRLQLKELRRNDSIFNINSKPKKDS